MKVFVIECLSATHERRRFFVICPDMVRAIVQFRTHIHGYRVIKATEVEDLEGILYHDGKYVAIGEME